VPIANEVTKATGSWTTVFVVAALLNIVAALLAMFVLKPIRHKAMAQG
jgi:OFA family oxalate/formate antiporter-like MFS transporter